MDIVQLIQTLVATIVGGLIVIATNWISDRKKKREVVQDWYERTYITEGIDPVMIYLFNLGLYFYNKHLGGFVRIKDIDAIPVEGIIRVQILLDSSVVPTLIASTHKLPTSEDRQLNRDVANLMTDTCRYLSVFRKDLLTAVPTTVKTKNDVIDASKVKKELKKISNDLIKLASRQEGESKTN